MQVSRVTWRLGRLAVGVLAVLAAGVLAGAPAASAAEAGKKSLTPFVECYFDNGDGTYTFSMGVTSTNAETVTVPVGGQNKVREVAAAVKDDLGQPTVFHPGTHNNVWAPTVTARDLQRGATWELTENKVSVTSLTACSEKPVPAEGNALAVVVFGVLVTAVGAWLLSGRRRRDEAVRPA